MKFPKTIDIKLQSEVFNNFRCQVAANSLDIDVKKKSIHHLHIDNINIKENWNIGLIYGASGSGKTTLVKEIFGNNIFNTIINEDEPIINQLPKELNYEDCANLLNGIGLNSVNCWIRPVKTLSNGQRARAEAVLLMCQNKEIIFIDEWTSVVDRTVIHPDYNGLGLGIKLINETSKLLKNKINCRIMAKFSAIPIFKSMIKQKEWKFLGETRLMGTMKTGYNMIRKSGFRDKGIKTFNFEFK